MKQKVKLAIILGAEFLAIAIVLILIFFSTKKQYTITFDLNGGTLVSGSLEQSVTQGHNATPPSAVKEGHYLRGWSGNYRGVTSDERVTAIWEYETTPGIEYSTKSGATYTEISGCFKSISGKLYIGAYHNDMIVFSIKTGAFASCTKVTDIYLLDGIITIGERAFANCSSLETIELPGTATVIGDSAFEGCQSLKSIVLPRSLETLGDSAFIGCNSLEAVYLPDTVSSIGENAFMGCENLKKVVFYSGSEPDIDNLTASAPEDEAEEDVSLLPSLRIGAFAFAFCTRLQEINLPSGLEVIEQSAFKGCSSLRAVSFSERLRKIGNEAFLGCVSLESANLKNGVTEIGRAAFKSCRSLQRVYIPATVTTVETDAFNECSTLSSAVIANGVATVKADAFKACPALKYIVIPTSITTIESGAFTTPGITVYFERSESQPQPVGYAPSWCADGAIFIYGYNGEEIVTDPSKLPEAE